jgi:5S rRNA maturation endonuclease (ribonuclease M5)
MTAFDWVLGELELRDVKVRYLGRGRAQAQCPCHDDRVPSLSITRAEDRVLLTCHAGCSNEAIATELGGSLAHLFDDNGNGHSDEEAVYRYLDEEGKPLFEVVRFEGKRFAQRLPDGTWGLNGARRVLYRLPRVLEAVRKGERIYVVEGEKDVHTLERIDVVATTNPGGAGKWRDEYSKLLRGATVTVLADRDESGRDHARGVAESLHGVAAEVDVAEPTVGKDITDHLALPATARAGWRPARPSPTGRPSCRRGPSTRPTPTRGWSRRLARRRSRATTRRRRSTSSRSWWRPR